MTLVVAALYRKTQLADEIMDKLRQRFPGVLAANALGWSVKVDEAQSHGKSIWEYAPSSTGARMFAAIATEIFDGAPARAAKRGKKAASGA